MRWEGYVAHTGEKATEYRILVGNPRREINGKICEYMAG
jgi:hypothetical protein